MIYNEGEDAYYIQHGADSVPKKLGSSGSLKINAITVSMPSASSTATLTGIVSGYTEIGVSDYSKVIIGSASTRGTDSTARIEGIKDGSAYTIATGSMSNKEIDISEYDSLRFNCILTRIIATNQDYSVTFMDITFD